MRDGERWDDYKLEGEPYLHCRICTLLFLDGRYVVFHVRRLCRVPRWTLDFTSVACILIFPAASPFFPDDEAFSDGGGGVVVQGKVVYVKAGCLYSLGPLLTNTHPKNKQGLQGRWTNPIFFFGIGCFFPMFEMQRPLRSS